jgi:hypothetical protein
MLECTECNKILREDSSYYDDDGDKTFWFTDEEGSRLVCENCYVKLIAEEYSAMDSALGIR